MVSQELRRQIQANNWHMAVNKCAIHEWEMNRIDLDLFIYTRRNLAWIAKRIHARAPHFQGLNKVTV